MNGSKVLKENYAANIESFRILLDRQYFHLNRICDRAVCIDVDSLSIDSHILASERCFMPTIISRKDRRSGPYPMHLCITSIPLLKALHVVPPRTDDS